MPPTSVHGFARPMTITARRCANGTASPPLIPFLGTCARYLYSCHPVIRVATLPESPGDPTYPRLRSMLRFLSAKPGSKCTGRVQLGNIPLGVRPVKSHVSAIMTSSHSQGYPVRTLFGPNGKQRPRQPVCEWFVLASAFPSEGTRLVSLSPSYTSWRLRWTP